MKRTIELLAVTLVGCSTSGELLSGKYCSRVSYVRQGNLIEINATCAAPYAVPQLPVNPAALAGIP